MLRCTCPRLLLGRPPKELNIAVHHFMNWEQLNNMNRLTLESFRFGESYSEGLPHCILVVIGTTPGKPLVDAFLISQEEETPKELKAALLTR